jgi:twitching motility protein PilT
LPRKDGKGRVLAAEILVNTATISDCIRDKTKTSKIREYIEKGHDQYGMQSFDQHLSYLCKKGVVTTEVAIAAASNPSDFERAMSFE